MDYTDDDEFDLANDDVDDYFTRKNDATDGGLPGRSIYQWAHANAGDQHETPDNLRGAGAVEASFDNEYGPAPDDVPAFLGRYTSGSNSPSAFKTNKAYMDSRGTYVTPYHEDSFSNSVQHLGTKKSQDFMVTTPSTAKTVTTC